jgi:hypothetical protein
MWDDGLFIVPKTVDIELYALIGGSIAGILPISRHISVKARALQNIVEGSQVAVVLDESLNRLSGEGIEVGLIRLFVTRSDGNSQATEP